MVNAMNNIHVSSYVVYLENLDLHLGQSVFPNNHIWGYAVLAVVQEHNPVTRTLAFVQKARGWNGGGNR